MTLLRLILFFQISLIFHGHPPAGDLKIMREVTGPYKTNCYLLYDLKTKEAALIDPGWKIDTLESFIKNRNLNLKYIFITHGHTDHYYYVPEIKKRFQYAKWGMSKTDYEKIVLCPGWPLKAYGIEWIQNTRKNKEESIYLDFDTRSVGRPDFFVEGDQLYRVGSGEIGTLEAPGHSPGGICYYTGNFLFSGDMLFYRSAGIIDHFTSDRGAFIKSVREIYKYFPDSTIVYPGHYQPTDIGSEKKENLRISLFGGEYVVNNK